MANRIEIGGLKVDEELYNLVNESTIETIGQLSPGTIFKEAVKILASKCQRVLSTL